MDLTDDELTAIADDLGVSPSELQSDAVKECAESVMRDDPDLTKSQAFAICQDMENEGRLAVTLAETQDPGAIERIEQSDGTVRYANLLLLGTGIWGDSGTQRHFLYSERTIEALAENVESTTVNLFHERENEVTDVGDLDPEALFIGEDDDGLYGDIVLHMENSASEFADEAMQNALETGGREGLQGPSLEIDGEDYVFNEDAGVHELIEGAIIGLGLVGLGVSPGPGSEDAAFAEQTRERAVALASSDTATVLSPQTHALMDPETIREQLTEHHAVQLGEDVDDETLKRLADAFDLELQDDDEDDEEEMEDDDEEESESDDDEDDEDDVEVNLEDVAARVDAVAEQVQENAERIEAIASTQEELSEQTVDIRESDVTLSDLHERVGEAPEGATLAEAITDLDGRLSDLEDGLQEPTSLADVGGAESNGEDDELILSEPGVYETPEGAMRSR